MHCPKCFEEGVLRRVGRTGFLQQAVFPHFGYFPWLCSACKKRVLLKHRGWPEKASQPHNTSTASH
jgi:hypothetical protein